jgi:2-hydroxychromene-2-carboxylate isomerase
VDLPRLKRAAGNTGPANIEIPPKIRYLMEDLRRWAELYGLPFGEIPRGKDYSRINKGVFYALEKDSVVDYITAAYDLVWGRGGAADDERELASIARKFDWEAADFLDYLSSDPAGRLWEASNEEAIARGVFGVPTVICDDHMWWGNDRMDFLERFLQDSVNSTRSDAAS